MGAVYLAQDTQLGNRLVAVKEMMQSNLSERDLQIAVEAFKREAYLLAGLQHPNLPSIHDYFEEGGRWYLVMSFIKGESLATYLARVPNGRLPLAEVLQIARELCNVLNYLHSQQPPIIFRDLKPGNIMRTMEGHIYLIDFGIARLFKPGQSKDTATYGSMGYSPPEQYGRAQTTVRSDIYSLGATLYEMLSGYDPSASPFRLPPLQSLVPTLPPRLVGLITRMLELDENRRPASIREVQQELQ
jgi:serine/threonine protein kinase